MDGAIMPLNPMHLRTRAREARLLAEQITDAVAKQTMLDVAADYERLAEQLEKESSTPAPKLK
jgi:hypothetical protein